ncbi:hypothetical protein [Paenibacillus senegalimassiliensis]|uniref:hypothetical protein n=1 Tax=Paenibacillus senegalimassiliensis TaxID=1737426 RepID=UPI00073F7DAC|nr:hypothetical protein [Paenibacillus senegalimassiliensis]
MYRLNRRFKALIAAMLVMVMLFSTGLDALAQAANHDAAQDNATNKAIMSLLEQEYGAEQAPFIYDTLRKLGLVDGQGQLATSPVIVDGQAYSLDELKELLSDPATDLSQIAEVDGQPITLESLKKIVDIESEGMGFTSATDAVYGVDSSTVTTQVYDPLQLEDDSYEGAVIATVSNIELKIGANYSEKNHYETDLKLLLSRIETVYITFQLNRAVDREVSFAYELMGDYIMESTSGVVVFAPNETVAILKIPARSSEDVFTKPYHEVENVDYSLLNFAGEGIAYDIYLETMDTLWSNFARVDYLHFSQFKNLDAIHFTANATINCFVAIPNG